MCATCGCSPSEVEGDSSKFKLLKGNKYLKEMMPPDLSQQDHKNSHVHNEQRQLSVELGGNAAKTISIEEDVLQKNKNLAHENRRVFLQNGIFTLNLVSSPGSGKTTLLEKTLRDLSPDFHFAVIEGDQQTDNDARRIAATGVPVHQINTGAGCHLDANGVSKAFQHFDLSSLDALFIENVGNLVCPALFDLGEHHKVVILSVTEGEDKPLKYPNMFAEADLMLINKIDLQPYVDFDLAQCKKYALSIQPRLQIIEISAKSGVGLSFWYDWLKKGIHQTRATKMSAQPSQETF